MLRVDRIYFTSSQGINNHSKPSFAFGSNSLSRSDEVHFSGSGNETKYVSLDTLEKIRGAARNSKNKVAEGFFYNFEGICKKPGSQHFDEATQSSAQDLTEDDIDDVLSLFGEIEKDRETKPVIKSYMEILKTLYLDKRKK